MARAEGRKNVRERFNVSKLQSEKNRRKHNNEVRNRFEALGESLGRSKKLSRPWIGSKTSEKIKERKEAKLKLQGARSE